MNHTARTAMKKCFVVPTLIAGITIMGFAGRAFAADGHPTQAGIAAEVKGEVHAATFPGKTAHRLKSGDEIFMGDKIETGADGQLQILLLDQTVFTLGPLSTITVDEFLYDPENAKDNAGVVRGVFRAVSAKVTNKTENLSGNSRSPAPQEIIDARHHGDQ